ncbi:hypothetical protein [Comamonas sp. JC664]|uniref:hypothetical protein n=1 Tax=Comamonas sp. JC664 TaxID=2801917 RepID=UPI00366E0D43
MVQFFDDVCFVCNGDLVWGLLADPNADMQPLSERLGNPAYLLAFCHYDSGGSFGYAVMENGVRTRTRLQTTDIPSFFHSLKVANHNSLSLHGCQQRLILKKMRTIHLKNGKEFIA